MAALLVALGVMAVLMTVAMPVWKQTAQREKEAELVFRGLQYARAIELMQRKMPGALPPNVDILVDQKFLRKKYKDPITGDDFDLVSPVQTAPGVQPGGQQPAGRGPGRGQASPPGGVRAGVAGVVSKSKERSIRLYNGRDRYNEWVFQPVQRTQTPGGTGPGANAPGQRGRGQQPQGGGRGQPSPDGGRGGRGVPPAGGRGPLFPGGPFSPGRPPG